MNKTEILKALISKTENEIYITELDVEFFTNQSVIYPSAKQPERAKEAQLNYLKNYLKFLKEKLEKCEK